MWVSYNFMASINIRIFLYIRNNLVPLRSPPMMKFLSEFTEKRFNA